MHIKDEIYTKIFLEDITKILYLNNNRLLWYIQQNGYISCTIKIINSNEKISKDILYTSINYECS